MLTADPSTASAETGGFSRGKAVTFGIAFLLAAGLLYYSLRGIEWRQAGHLIAGARLRYLAVAAIVMTGSLFLRAFRWRILLQAEGRVPVGTAFWATSAGYFGNNFLPARAGELVRTFMDQPPLRAEFGLRPSHGFIGTSSGRDRAGGN